MNKDKICPETQIWEENGEIKKIDIVHEARGPVDLTPHPTRARVLMVDGKIISIDSVYAEQHGYTNPELLSAIITMEVIKTKYYES